VKLKRILLVRNTETAADSGFDLFSIPVDHFLGERLMCAHRSKGERTKSESNASERLLRHDMLALMYSILWCRRQLEGLEYSLACRFF
jgi:hypothetical protein